MDPIRLHTVDRFLRLLIVVAFLPAFLYTIACLHRSGYPSCSSSSSPSLCCTLSAVLASRPLLNNIMTDPPTSPSTTADTNHNPVAPVVHGLSDAANPVADAAVDKPPIPVPPPQPPLFDTDDNPAPLPAIVHGIDDDDDDHPGSGSGGGVAGRPPSIGNGRPGDVLTQAGSGLTDVITSLSERVQRAIRMATAATTAATSSAGLPSALDSSAADSAVLPLGGGGAAPAQPPPTIFLFGDSLTQYAGAPVSTDDAGAPGWATLLRHDYVTSADVIVRGHSGYNSRWALYILPRELRGIVKLDSTGTSSTIGIGSNIKTTVRTTTTTTSNNSMSTHTTVQNSEAGSPSKRNSLPYPTPPSHRSNVRLVTIFFGANDAVVDSSPQYVPLDEYATNLATMVTFVRSYYGITPLLLTPPPVTPTALAISGGRTLDNVARYAAACVSVARNMNAPFIDVFSEFVTHARRHNADGDLEHFFSDGLHFSAEGNRLLYELVTAKIREIAPDLAHDRIKPFAPLWSDVDATDPSNTLGQMPREISALAPHTYRDDGTPATE